MGAVTRTRTSASGAQPDDAKTPTLAFAVLAKLCVSLITLAAGFRAVSDDDYARVVIAEEWARSPKLDPSGTSWLPLPFYVDGAAMLAFGRSLFSAQMVAVASGALAVALVCVAGHWITGSKRSAFAGALIAAALPWSARLGVSTVPELLASALTLLAMAATVRAGDAEHGGRMMSRRALVGALALLAACLSRYEPWFVAAGFSVIALFEIVRGRARGADAARLVAAVGLALAGPVAWMAWNAHAHGSALHFVDRVAAYRDAVDHGSLTSRVFGYLWAIARAEPELWAIGALLLVHLRARHHAAYRSIVAPFARPLLLALFLVLALTVSSIRGGAPTHHSERALFAVILLACVVLGHALVRSFEEPRLLPSKTAAAAALMVVAAASFPVRRWVLQSESYAVRTNEVAMGHTFAARAERGQRALVDVVDYSYFAIEAASGRPEDIVPAGKVDPASRGATASHVTGDLMAKARGLGLPYVLAHVDADAPLPAGTLAQHGPWILIDVAPKTP